MEKQWNLEIWLFIRNKIAKETLNAQLSISSFIVVFFYYYYYYFREIGLFGTKYLNWKCAGHSIEAWRTFYFIVFLGGTQEGRKNRIRFLLFNLEFQRMSGALRVIKAEEDVKLENWKKNFFFYPVLLRCDRFLCLPR